MKKIIQNIVIAILVSISFLAVNAQEQTIISVNETSATTEKVEKKVESAKKRQSNSDEDSWTGFYVGGFGGYSSLRADANMTTPDDDNGNFGITTARLINSLPSRKLSSNKFSGGGTFGYNYQKGRLLIGGEVDFGSHRINSSDSVKRNLADISGTFTITHNLKTDWLLTARPRVGLATKKVLIYGTGGLAVTNMNYAGNFETFVLFTRTADGSIKKNQTGWNAGGGVEIKVNKHWSVKGEYLYNQFRRASFTTNNLHGITLAGNPITTPDESFTYSTDLKSHSLRFGVNFRF